MTKQEIDTYWLGQNKSLAALKAKPELTPDEWKAVVYESVAIHANNQTGMFHGGTQSSGNFRTAKALLDVLLSGIQQPEVFRGEQPNLQNLIDSTQAVLQAAKAGLIRHNDQPEKLFGYDVETGEWAESDTRFPVLRLVE